MKPVFIHINKNAGTSITGSAGDHIVVAGHRTAASWVAEHGRTSPLFSVIRHPYDRVLSEYRYRRRRFDWGEQNAHLENLYRPFDEWVFVTFLGDENRTQAYFDRTGVYYYPHQMIGDTLLWFIPQTQWLSDANGELLVDDLLRFETLGQDWRRFSAKYGFASELEHLNASPPPPGEQLFTNPCNERRVRDVIYDYYRDDFDAFGYGRDPS